MRIASGIRAIGRTEWAALAVAALFMTFVGAFDTGQRPPLLRAAYWLVVMMGGGVAGGIVDGWLSSRHNFGIRPRAALQVIGMTFPIVAIVVVASAALFSAPVTLVRLVELFPAVFLVSAVVVSLAWLIRRGRWVPAAPFDSTAPALLRGKLAPKLGRAELLAVQAEDHYLRVHTVAGSGLILMRFGEALEALAARDGYRTHRSWWVARAAVDQVRWGRGRGVLTLRNGVRVPVSRSYFSSLQAASWTEVSTAQGISRLPAALAINRSPDR